MTLKLYPDFRIGGRPKFILASEPPELMFIPDEIRKCVVYIDYRLSNGEFSPQGTAFLVARPIEDTEYSFSYLVTAAHLIQGIGSKESFDGKILLRANFADGNAYTIETDYTNWLFHPDESEVDVAILPHQKLEADTMSIPFEMILGEDIHANNYVQISREVFLTGLFYNHRGRTRNIPIIRAGMIAAMPEEKVRTSMGLIDAYLIEARSIGGLSGSPVFIHFGASVEISYGMSISGGNVRPYYLLGLMHGHFDADLLNADSTDMVAKARELVNMGIAIVVPAGKILEVINQSVIKDKEMEVEKELRKHLMPTADSVGDETGFTEGQFEDALKQASRRPSEPVAEKNETSE